MHPRALCQCSTAVHLATQISGQKEPQLSMHSPQHVGWMGRWTMHGSMAEHHKAKPAQLMAHQAWAQEGGAQQVAPQLA